MDFDSFIGHIAFKTKINLMRISFLFFNCVIQTTPVNKIEVSHSSKENIRKD